MSTPPPMIIPPALQPGDRIAICSPAGIVKPENVHRAMAVLREQGWDPWLAPNALERWGTYAGTPAQRLADMRQAILDPSTRAILCSRGGYGCVHLLEELARLDLRANPKWIVGFSDISALLALWQSQGVAAIHGVMTSRLADTGGEDDDSLALFDILSGHPLSYEVEPDGYNRPGTVTAPLAGGNFSVVSDLIGTPFDVVRPGTILFLEDLNEPAYKIERMIYQLRLSGVMERLAGLIVGQFTKIALEVDRKTVPQLFAEIAADYTFPMAFNAPVGHVHSNIPLATGLTTTLTVTDHGAVIDQRQGSAGARANNM